MHAIGVVVDQLPDLELMIQRALQQS
jgi:hypothetical protein